MSKLLEKHHGFISAMYYKLLKEGDFKNYEDAFLMATRRYAEQRGSRMAQRAIRDGKPLTYETYMSYGEWVFTDEYNESLNGKTHIEIIEDERDYKYNVYACPWADAYKDLGLSEDGGALYCKDLDASIARGFNPELTYIVSQTLQRHDKCVQTLKDAKNGGNTLSLLKGNPDNMKDFDYHCGHIYKTFCEYMTAIYGTKGVKLSSDVLNAFEEKFGQEAADILVKYLNTDFNLI